MTRDVTVWLAAGFAGQAIFTARFLVQWAASEKKRECVVPVAFWWLSLSGGAILFAYATYKQDPVIILGQGMGVFVYVRNLMLVEKSRRRRLKQASRIDREAESASVPQTSAAPCDPLRSINDRAA